MFRIQGLGFRVLPPLMVIMQGADRTIGHYANPLLLLPANDDAAHCRDCPLGTCAALGTAITCGPCPHNRGSPSLPAQNFVVPYRNFRSLPFLGLLGFLIRQLKV